jgi:acyl carrier protein
MDSSCNHHSMTGMKISATNSPFWIHDSKFTHLRATAAAAAAAIGAQESLISGKPLISLNAAFKACKSFDEAESVLCTYLIDKVCTVLMLDVDEIDVSKSISSYGLDSLVAIEIRNFIAREAETNLQVLELLTSKSITLLATLICEKSKLVVNKSEV